MELEYQLLLFIVHYSMCQSLLYIVDVFCNGLVVVWLPISSKQGVKIHGKMMLWWWGCHPGGSLWWSGFWPPQFWNLHPCLQKCISKVFCRIEIWKPIFWARKKGALPDPSVVLIVVWIGVVKSSRRIPEIDNCGPVIALCLAEKAAPKIRNFYKGISNLATMMVAL